MLAGKRILFCEDDRDFFELAEMVLLKAGCEVRHVADGRDLLQAAGDYRPDLVILDVMLPGVDGYTLRHQLAEGAQTEKIPVLVLTALEPARSMFTTASVTDFLTKPVRVDTLLKTIERLLTPKPHG